MLVVGDYFTKWIDAIPLPDEEASTIARALLDRVFSSFGLPEQIHSDQGRNFESKLVHDICEIFVVHKSRTTGFRPSCNGFVER